MKIIYIYLMEMNEIKEICCNHLKNKTKQKHVNNVKSINNLKNNWHV